LAERTGRRLHLGLEPEPLCYLETTAETVDFFEEMAADRPRDRRLFEHLGVNYDTCHLAVEF
jgi:sugar phosphate isomerase/epimerase